MSSGRTGSWTPSAATIRGLRIARRGDSLMRGDVLTGTVMAPAHSGAYGWLMLAGIGVSLVLWSRLTRRDSRMIPIYLGALAGAFLGAKLVYLAAEGWLHWHDPNR